MIAKVIPNKKFPRNISYFDYLIPEELREKIKIGKIVEVPLRNSKIEGVVFDISDTYSQSQSGKSKITKLKPIQHVTPYSIRPFQIKLLKWMADYYITSFPSILKLIMPEIPKKNFHVSPIKIANKKNPV